MAPAAAWKSLYEPFIRRAAGLGVAPTAPDPDHYAQHYALCDVLVVGAGGAGLAAALAAGEAGARVILCRRAGGNGRRDCWTKSASTIDRVPARDWVAAALSRLRAMANVTLLPRTQAFGYYAQNFLGLAERVTDHLAEPSPKAPRERLWQVRAGDVVLAHAAPSNARWCFLKTTAPESCSPRRREPISIATARDAGKRAVAFLADDSGYAAALDLHRAGIEIAAIADIRPTPAGPGHALALAAGLPIQSATVITGVSGRTRVCSAQFGVLGSDGSVTSGRRVRHATSS